MSRLLVIEEAFIPVRLEVSSGREFLHLDGMTYDPEATYRAAERVDARWAEANPLQRVARCRIEEVR